METSQQNPFVSLIHANKKQKNNATQEMLSRKKQAHYNLRTSTAMENLPWHQAEKHQHV
jgi:hypothetical protein